MSLGLRVGFIVVLLFPFHLSVQAQPDSLNVTIAPADTNDTAFTAESQENEFQEDLDSLLSSNQDIDTSFAWSTSKINSGHFDSEKWTDTSRLVLVDSAQKKFFVHPCYGKVTSNFGARHWLWHYGVDTKLLRGDTVRAAFEGVVRVKEYDRHGYGVVIVMRHINGLETIYGHLSKAEVVPGQRLKAGDVIGRGGSTGHSTGPHLHLEMRYYGEPFDPNCIIDFENGTLKSYTLVLTKDNFAYLIELRKITWHTIRRGENLGLIARRYHTKVTTICKLNHISGRTILRIGRKIAVKRVQRTDSTVPL
jgi:murein DD-endopeptidase MepM/ murein hydrolase activator NlpD